MFPFRVHRGDLGDSGASRADVFSVPYGTQVYMSHLGVSSEDGGGVSPSGLLDCVFVKAQRESSYLCPPRGSMGELVLFVSSMSCT